MKKLIKVYDLFSIIIFIFSQIFLFLSIKNIVLQVGSKLLIIDKDVYHGAIFISGEFPINFSKSHFAIAAPFNKIKAIFNNFEFYLYLVNGYFSSPRSEKQQIYFILNSFKSLNVSAINLTENEINNIYPLVVSNSDLFISANLNNVNVLRFKIISLKLNNKINQKRSLPIFITGVSSRFSFYKNKDFEDFHKYIKETTDLITNSLNDLYDDAESSRFRLLLFDCDYLILDKIISKTNINFNLIVCSNSNITNKIKQAGSSYIIFCDNLDKAITKIDIYLKNNKIYFEANKIPLFRMLLQTN